jgi:hypothetical protein
VVAAQLGNVVRIPERHRFGGARGRAAIFDADCRHGVAFRVLFLNVTGNLIRSS